MVKDIQIYYLENFRRIEADWDQKASVKLYKQIRKTPKTPLKGHFNNYMELNGVEIVTYLIVPAVSLKIQRTEKFHLRINNF
jgi:hypothetical protein